jgi:glycosyltransferase involved in cell wall biosynthesis
VALLAYSEYAARQFRRQLGDHPGRGALVEKLEVLYPAVAARRAEPKSLSAEGLRLLFVGKDFMRKGGPALMRAHELLRERGVPVSTTVVSSLRWTPHDEYIDPPSSELVSREHARLAQEGVTHHARLSNTAVLRAMDEADFLVLPTLHDTFGFVALEALASATPVIASAANALPEIVADGECGFLLALETDDELGRWAWTYRKREPGFLEAYETATGALGDEIADRLSECWESPDRYPALSYGALERVRARFDVGRARARLEELYEICRARLPRWRRTAAA